MGKLFAYLAFLASAYNKARYPQRFSVPDSEGVRWKVHERQMSRQELKTKKKTPKSQPPERITLMFARDGGKKKRRR